MGETSVPLPLRGLRTLVAAACLALLIQAIAAAHSYVLILLTAVFIALVVAAPIFLLQHKGLPFGVALLLVLGAAVSVLAGIGTIVGTSINQFTRALPSYQARIEATTEQATETLAKWGIEIPYELAFSQFINPARAMDLVAGLFSGLGSVVANSSVILLLVIFILLEASTFPAKLSAAFGDQADARNKFGQLTASVNRYLVIKTTVSLGTGVLAAGLCAVLGVDFAVLWGLLAFLLNYVPTFGSILASVPPVLLAIVQFGFGRAAVVLIGYLVINSVIGNIVEPRFMGHGLGLSPLAVFLSLLFWGWLLGPVGMLLSIPLTVAVKIVMESTPETRWVGILLSPGAAVERVEKA